MDHLTARELILYRVRKLDPVGLLRVDDHLAECEQCRRSLSASMEAPAMLVAVREQIQLPVRHLSQEQLSGYVRRALGPAERGLVSVHLEACSLCAAELRELSAWDARLRSNSRPSIRYLAIAAMLLIGCGLTALIMLYKPVTTEFAWLPPTEREFVTEAIRNRKLPAFELQRNAEILMGTEPQGAFSVLSPLATSVRDSLPTFRWTPLAGATGYSVAILDEHLQVVATSPQLSGTEWRPSKPLTPGRIYIWQVTATTGERRTIAPAPPAPQAQFKIADTDVVSAIQKLERAHGGSPLALAVLCAKSGLMEDARHHLLAVPDSDPRSAVAKDFLRTLGGK